MRKIILMFVGCLVLFLGGCQTEDDVSAVVVSEAEIATEEIQETVAMVNEQAVTAVEEIVEPLTLREAYDSVCDTLSDDSLLIMEGETGLVIEDTAYYVFIVAQSNGKALGQVAVCKVDGTLYYYEGERVLSDFSKLVARISQETDQVETVVVQTVIETAWDGDYTFDENTLHITYTDGASMFSFSLNGQSDAAMVSSNTAVSLTGDVSFTYQEDGNVALEGKVTGTFVLVVEVAETVDTTTDVTTDTTTDVTETTDTTDTTEAVDGAESTESETDTTEGETDQSTETDAQEGEAVDGEAVEGDATVEQTTDTITDATTEQTEQTTDAIESESEIAEQAQTALETIE